MLYWGNGRPRVVIEVKKQVSRFTQLKQDARRICDALRNRSNRIQCGLLAFYTSWNDTTDQSAPDRTREILNEVQGDAQEYVKNVRTPLKTSMRDGGITVDGDSAWVAAVLQMERE